MRKLLGDLFTDLRQLERCINDVTKEIEAIAFGSPRWVLVGQRSFELIDQIVC
jgi:hypothetical protein